MLIYRGDGWLEHGAARVATVFVYLTSHDAHEGGATRFGALSSGHSVRVCPKAGSTCSLHVFLDSSPMSSAGVLQQLNMAGQWCVVVWCVCACSCVCAGSAAVWSNVDAQGVYHGPSCMIDLRA